MAMVLSAAMMLRVGLGEDAAASDLERCVDQVLAGGYRTGDLMSEGCTQLAARRWAINCWRPSQADPTTRL